MKKNWLCSLLILIACKQAAKSTEPAFEVRNDEVTVREDSPFLKHLEIVKATQPSQGDVALKTVGQIIILANSSGVLSNMGLSWVELDPELTHNAGLNLKSFSQASVGTAFGVTLIPAEYTAQIHPNEVLEISRYGLKKSEIKGVVEQVHALKDDQTSVAVTFQIHQGQEWYPGTNCEVRFPLLHVQTAEVPTTSILHEGLREFVLKEFKPHHFRILPISIIDETPTSAQIIGVSPGDAIIGSGAILLKPELHNFIHDGKEAHHVF